jgi:hypothetical protein
VIKDPETIIKAVETARKQSPAAKDPKFSVVKDAKVGLPVMVYTPEEKPAFWMVPFLIENRACGFAFVELSGKISKLGILGSTPEDRLSWIDVSFLKKPPASILAEIQAKFPGLKASEPILSYDTSPARWAWRVEIKNKIKSIVFITPGGWYERKPSERDISREG